MQSIEFNVIEMGCRMRCIAVTAILLSCAGALLYSQQQIPSAQPAKSPIHFTPRPIPFSLDSCETPERHVPETMSGGVAVFDYINDGNLDIFFTNGADISSLKKTSPKYWNRLFRNNGDGTFTDVTEKSGLAGTGYDTGVAIGDYDNDGYEDIFVAGVYRNTLYHNNGDGTFTDVTEKAGLSRLDKKYGPLWSVGAAWVDVNNDGFLDLFVVNYLSWDRSNELVCKVNGKPDYCHPKFFHGLPNQLFLNNGNGTFTDISEQSGIRAHIGKGMGVTVADFSGNGLPDIFVTNDKLFNSLFHNRGTSISMRLALKPVWHCQNTAISSPGWARTLKISTTMAFPTLHSPRWSMRLFLSSKTMAKGSSLRLRHAAA